MTDARRVAALLMALMVVQSVLGLARADQYRDVEWIKATWYGNDWTTLVVAVPLLGLGRRLAARGSGRGLLLVLGLAGYAVYNYAFYLFGAALNIFFALYVVLFLTGIATIGLMTSRLDVATLGGSLRHTMLARFIAGYLVFVAAGLTIVWLGLWAAHAVGGRATPIEPEAFKVVAALDLTLMVPAMAVGGVLLWRRSAWGYPVATIAAVQGALYLLVLCVNSAVAISRDVGAASGELLIWGPLALFTTSAAILLLTGASNALPQSASRPDAPD